MTIDVRKAIVRRYYEQIWNRGNMALIDQLMAPEYLNRDPAIPGGLAYGRAGLRQLIAGYRAAFPDIHMAIDGQVAEGETVVTAWTATGTMLGSLNGHSPTRNRASVTGITVTRFADDLIVEERVNWDTLGLLAQCGLLSHAAPDAAKRDKRI